MYKKAQLYLLHCQTPLHAGSGEAHSYIDLPIQREKHTLFPKVEGSSLKGAIREAFEDKKGVTGKNQDGDINRLFGKDENPDASASLGFSDARLLLFPVRSAYGIIAWITCPRVLQKFVKEHNLMNPDANIALSDLPEIQDNEIITGNGILQSNKALLEEYLFTSIGEATIKINDAPISDWFGGKLFPNEKNERKFFKARFTIVNDTVFREFTERFTVVITRNKINNKTGAVQDGALFTVEYLPDESVLYHFVTASDEFGKQDKDKTDSTHRKTAEENLDAYNSMEINIMQLGGDMTTGKGIITITKI
jgi:CRISPR-associated protein Cmr4